MDPQTKRQSPNSIWYVVFAYEVSKILLTFDRDVHVHERNERGNEGCDTKSALHVIVLIHHVDAHENKMCIYEYEIFYTWNN